MKRTIFLFSFLSLFWIIGCSKFEQDFTLNKINELTISTEKTAFELVQFDSLLIAPTISESSSSPQGYSYEWKAIIADTVFSFSKERDLHMPVTFSPGAYLLQYIVTDKSNGSQTMKLYTLKVNGAFYEGWLVTHNKQNKGVLSFVRSDDKVFLSPAQDVNHKEYPGKALATHYSYLNNYPALASLLYFTTEGVVRFNPNNFDEIGNTAGIMGKSMTFVDPGFGISTLASDQYIIDNGNLYAGFGIFNPEEILSPFSDRFTGDYSLFPIAFPATPFATYFYDNKYKRFMQVAYRTRIISNSTGNTTAAFNMSNVNRTMVAAEKGGTTNYNSNFYFVMEGTDGRYFMSLNGATPKYNVKVADTNAPDFSRATKFSASASNIENMYYAYDNKIYLYDIKNNTATKIYEFAVQNKVTFLQVQKKTSKQIAVSTLNGTAGELYLFQIDDMGHFVGNTYSKKFEGFGDIIHLSYRD
ncbi:PKD-like family lipoprotein [Pedobacter sp.]|uniref:PKD-like family lipoprotein n=1 Tax=Pedobacter sp. TaxID=1411316 RepID=UPI003D7F7F3B